MKHDQGSSFGIRQGANTIDLLDESQLRPLILCVTRNILCGVLVERCNPLDSPGKRSPFLEQRRPVVGMIKNLKLLLVGTAICDHVCDLEAIGARIGRDFGLHLEFRAIKHALIDSPAHTNAIRRMRIDNNLNFARGNVGDLSVEGKFHCRLVTHIVDELVEARMAITFQPTTNHPLIETLEPAEAAAALQVDEPRMDDFFDRRIPAQRDVVQCNGQHAHPASRTNRELQPPIIDNNYVHALLLAAVQRHFLH